MQTPVSADLYDKDYYKKYNHGFETFESKSDLMPEIKAKFAKVNFTGKRVLDVGCGRGEFVVFTAKQGASESVGIDYSKASVEISNDFAAKTAADKLDTIKISQMDAKRLHFSDNSFDIVVMLDIVEHLHDWELTQCMNEVARVLKPSGKLFLHTSPNKLVMSAVRTLANIVGVKLKSSEFHVNEQTYFSLKKYLSKLFSGKYLLEKDKKYWYNQMAFRGKALKFLAKTADLFLDNAPVHFVLSLFPISILYCTDLWFIGNKK